MKAEILNKEKELKGNRLHEFKSGEFGVIRKWDRNEEHIGSIVKRIDNALYTVESILNPEKHHGNKWSDFNFLATLEGNFYIKPLKTGDQIVITI